MERGLYNSYVPYQLDIFNWILVLGTATYIPNF